jgi:hypothetical protein
LRPETRVAILVAMEVAMNKKQRDVDSKGPVPNEIHDDPWLLDWDDEGLECLGESDWPPLAATDKIEECGYFLELMRGTTDWKQFRWLTSAFLEAARAAMDWMAYAANHYWEHDVDGEEVHDDCYVGPLKRYMTTSPNGRKILVQAVHVLLKQLCEYRKQTAHYGPLWIKPKQVSTASDFVFVEGEQHVLPFCEQALELLARIPHELHEEVLAARSE